MSIALPLYPSPTDGTQPSYLDWGGILRPIFGGSLQKLARLGDRFALDVVMPPMPVEAVGRQWVSRLIQGQRQGVILPWPQPGIEIGDPGAPRVNGAGQAGSSISLLGFMPGYVVRDGQFFSIIHGGRRYIEMATADVVASESGMMVLPIAPMLRIQPAANAVCEFAPPMIEGFLDGDARDWTPSTAMTIGLNFTITEAK